MDEDKKRRLQELANKQSGQQNNVNSQQPTNSSSQANPKQKYSGPVNNSGNHGNDYQNRPIGFDQSQYKTCKYCGTRIPANAKICPNCRKRQGVNPGLRVVLIILAVVVVIGILGSIFGRSGEDETESNDEISAELSTAEETEATQSATEEPQMAYEITYQNCEIGEANFLDEQYYPTTTVQIQNTGNTNITIDEVTFDLLNEDGSLAGVIGWSLTAKDAPKIIQPGEYGYIYSTGSVDGNVTENGNYILDPKITVKETNKDAVRYDVSDVSVSSDSYGSVIGRVTNNTNDDASMVPVYFVAFDQSGNFIGIASTTIDELNSGDTQTFNIDFMMEHFSGSDIGSYEIYACER